MKETMPIVFASRLKDLLYYAKTVKKMDYRAVSSELGISLGALSNYANGTQQPNITVLRKISELFDVSSDYLLGLSENPYLSTDIQVASKTTGIEGYAIEFLQNMLDTVNKNGDNKEYHECLSVLSRLIDHKDFIHVLYTLYMLVESVDDMKKQGGIGYRFQFGKNEEIDKNTIRLYEEKMSKELGYSVKIMGPTDHFFGIKSVFMDAIDRIANDISGYSELLENEDEYGNDQAD